MKIEQLEKEISKNKRVRRVVAFLIHWHYEHWGIFARRMINCKPPHEHRRPTAIRRHYGIATKIASEAEHRTRTQ